MGNLFKEINEAYDNYHRLIKDKGEEAFKEAFKEFFEANPKTNSVYWRQYTPYFNDGDSCTFSVHDFEIEFDEDDVSKEESDKMWNDLHVISRNPDSLFECVFGDHVKVEATPEGISVSRCHHD